MSAQVVIQWLYVVLLVSMILVYVYVSNAQGSDKSKQNGASRSQAQQPNIVLVIADDYGYNDIGYHGSEIKTPNLNKLAKSGVILENYYVHPFCTPTRGQLLSGRYQIHTGLQHRVLHPCVPSGLPLNIPTVADLLAKSGYSTHMIGKWHLGFYQEPYLPWRRGFDTFFGFLNGAMDYFTHERDYNGTPYLDLHQEATPVRNESGQYSTHLFSSKAADLIASHDQSKPFFLYLAYQAVHFPLQVPKEYEDRYKHIKDEKRRSYAGMVAAMDEGVANVTEALKNANMWENTVFIFTTDNGGAPTSGGNNYPLRGEKMTLWEGGIHAVGFVAGGGLTPQGQVNREFIDVSDWLPTLLKIAGSKVNVTSLNLDGVDQWETINAGASSPRQTLLHNIDPLYPLKGSPHPNHAWDTRVRAALRSGDYKVITGDPGLGEWTRPPGNASLDSQDELSEDVEKNLWLFNIADDPNEHKDLSQEKPEIVQQLLDMMVKFNETAVPANFPKADPDCNPGLHGGVWGPWQ